MRMFMSNHDLSNFVLQWWVAGLFQRHRVSTKIELTYLGASTRDTGLMGLDPESREMENVYKLIPDENSTVRRNYLRTWCAQEEFWRSPNVWKVSFWWMHSTILTWYTNHSLKWWKRRKSFNSMTSTFQEAGTSTTGGEGADDGHHPSERRNRWFDYPITILSPTVDHADNKVNEEAMMAWFEGYSNKTDTTSPVDGSEIFETRTLSK